MKHLLPMLAVFAACAGLIACDDETTTIGSGLINSKSEVVIDSTFTAHSVTVDNNAVQSRTLTQLLGLFEAKNYGTLRSNFATQFMPTLRLDTAGVKAEDIDSLRLMMFFTPGDFTGDSLVPMGLTIYPLIKQLPSPIYSDFNPDGYYSTEAMSSYIYSGAPLYSDSVLNLNYRTLHVTLPTELGRKMYEKFIEDSTVFSSPQAFNNWFPGLYIASTFGSGRMVRLTETRMQMYYHQHTTYEKAGEIRDTIYHKVQILCEVTPEVVTNNEIHYEMSDTLRQLAAAGHSLIVSPLGFYTEMTFPAEKLITTFRKHAANDMTVLNALTMSLPVKTITNDYGIEPPEKVLFVLSKNLKEFFAKSQINNNVTSFVSTYDKQHKCYDISDMRSYLANLLEKERVEIEDYTFTIVPVEIETETTSGSYYSQGTTYVIAVTPDIKPAMAELLVDEAKITLTFSKNSINSF